jgi:hypothetical protein
MIRAEGPRTRAAPTSESAAKAAIPRHQTAPGDLSKLISDVVRYYADIETYPISLPPSTMLATDSKAPRDGAYGYATV